MHLRFHKGTSSAFSVTGLSELSKSVVVCSATALSADRARCVEKNTFGDRASVRVIRRWLVRFAIPILVAAAVHGGLLFFPWKITSIGARGTGDAQAEKAHTLVDFGNQSSVSSAQAPASAASQAASGGAAADAPDHESIMAAAENALAELVPQPIDLTTWAQTNQTVANSTGGFAAFGAGNGAKEFNGSTFGSGLAAAFPMDGNTFGGRNRSGYSGASVSVTFMPDPMYPEIARRERRQGTVELTVLVDSGGRARNVSIATTSGHADLDESARGTVLRQWRFQTGTSGTTRDCVVRITFNLNS